ncbi:unnamed protein product [Caenorhabditis angaria]|uniref:Uncharacterized protein n=1 Tax=Caenorhabditis angaria TaxID=860376 RepID=A0A9P1N7F9_9PELO|nr:unnamed protein product [Caenorhabditis angaria]
MYSFVCFLVINSVHSQMFQPVMFMPIQYPMFGNPFDNGFELEYSPLTQIVSSIAHMMELHHIDQSRRMHYEPNIQPQPVFHPKSQNSQKFSLIPYSQTNQFPSQMSFPSSSSRVVNSLPSKNLPPVMYKIGDLMSSNNKNQENLYDLRKIQGFPILKTEDTDFDKERPERKQVKIFDLAKRFLGLGKNFENILE